jgi:N utilization substance protein A
LAAKLLGWRIDIKSEEEKRQEAESQFESMVVPGAPVSVLLDHGVTDEIVEKLVQGGIPTVEALGAMTPEDLEAIPGVGPEAVERIQAAVNSYYGQFEGSMENAPPAEAPVADGVSAAAPAEAPEAVPENESVTIEKTEVVE